MSVNVNGPLPTGNPPAPRPGAAGGENPALVPQPVAVPQPAVAVPQTAVAVPQPAVAVPAYGVPGYSTPATIATMGRRLAAYLIDVILMFVVAVLLGLLLGLLLPAGASDGSVLVVVLVLGFVYEVGFIAVRGATPGKSAVGIRVIREVDGRVPGWGPALVRWLIPTAAGLVFLELLVYLSPFFDRTRRNQGWHDKAARTLVVKT